MHFRNFQQRISRMKNSKSSPHLDGVGTDNTLPYTNFQVIEYRCLVKLCFSRSKVPKAKKIWLALMPNLIMLTIHKNLTCCCRLQLWMMALRKRMHFVLNTCCLVQMNSPNFASPLPAPIFRELHFVRTGTESLRMQQAKTLLHHYYCSYLTSYWEKFLRS